MSHKALSYAVYEPFVRKVFSLYRVDKDQFSPYNSHSKTRTLNCKDTQIKYARDIKGCPEVKRESPNKLS